VTTTSVSRSGGVTGDTSSTTKFDVKECVETGNIKTTTTIESKGGLKSHITGDHTTIVTQVRDKNGNILSTEGKYERSSTLFHPSTSTTFSGTGTMWTRFDGMGPGLIMSITSSIRVAQVALPSLLMQFHAAKDARVINYGRIIGPLAVSIYAILMFSLGAFCHPLLDPRLSPAEVGALLKDTDWVIPKAIMMLAPEGVRGFILAAPVAASVSTLAVTFIVLSAALVRDVVQTYKPAIPRQS
jgi:hypothetical protein